MPDDQGRTKTDQEDLPESPLHAHSSAMEDQTHRPRRDEHTGERLDDHQNDPSEATSTGGSTSGGAPRENAGEDPSNA